MVKGVEIWTDGRTEWTDGRRKNYSTPTSSVDKKKKKKKKKKRRSKTISLSTSFGESIRNGAKAIKVSKGAKIRNQYNQVPHLTKDTNGRVTNSHLDTTNESQEVSPFPAGDHKAHINRHTQRHTKHKPKKKYPQKKYHLGMVSKIFNWRA